jgi:hypothetical protein
VANVPAPPAGVPPHSLIRSALTNRDGDADGNWTRGLAYVPETVGGYRALSDCTAEEVDYGADAGVPAAVEYRPWDLQVQDPCASVFGYDEQAVTDRLRRAADAVQSFAIARELWTGELSRAEAAARGNPDDSNLYLTKDPTVVADTPVSPRRGLGLLEQAAGEAFHGQQVFLHLSRAARPFFPELVKVGNLLFTNIDNVVVADAGYPGTPPEGAAAADGVAWVYCTGPVVVRRTPFVPDGADLAETLDVRTNTLRRTGSLRVAATFDTAAYFAVPITLS